MLMKNPNSNCQVLALIGGKDTNKHDGPSLESGSYLNIILRYIGPWDPWTFGPETFGLLDFRTLYFFTSSLVTSEFICEEISMLFHSEKFSGWVGGWVTLQL